MDLKEVGCEDVEWIQLAPNIVQRLVFVNLVNEPSGSIKGLEFLDQLSDYQLHVVTEIFSRASPAWVVS
jgi:sporulation-control protein spo0M